MHFAFHELDINCTTTTEPFSDSWKDIASWTCVGVGDVPPFTAKCKYGILIERYRSKFSLSSSKEIIPCTETDISACTSPEEVGFRTPENLPSIKFQVLSIMLSAMTVSAKNLNNLYCSVQNNIPQGKKLIL